MVEGGEAHTAERSLCVLVASPCSPTVGDVRSGDTTTKCFEWGMKYNYTEMANLLILLLAPTRRVCALSHTRALTPSV